MESARKSLSRIPSLDRKLNGFLSSNLSYYNDDGVIVTANLNEEVALDKVESQSIDSKFGYIQNLPNTIVRTNSSTWVDLWFQGGKRTAPTTSFTPFIASDNVADTSIEVAIIYFDDNNDKILTTINLDAVDARTPVSLGITATELTRGYIVDTSAVGVITVATTNSFTNGVPDNQDEILIAVGDEDNQSQVCADRVPSNTQRIINHISLHVIRLAGNDGSVQAVFQTRTAGTNVWRTREPLFSTNTAPFSENITGIVLNAGDDFRIRIRDVSDGNTYVSGNVQFKDFKIS